MWPEALLHSPAPRTPSDGQARSSALATSPTPTASQTPTEAGRTAGAITPPMAGNQKPASASTSSDNQSSATAIAVKAVVPFAVRPVLVVVGLKCALELAVAGRYGWHRDELYYAVAGLHLQGGYVEFPPVTALFAALGRELFGWSLVGFHAFTILAAA